MQPTKSALFQIDGQGEYIQGPISLDQPVGTLPIVDDARWSAALTSDSWVALLVWLILLVVMQLAMWPVVRRIFSRFPDQGWGFGRLVTLMSAGYLVWLLASVDVVAFRAVWCAAVAAAVGIGAWLVGGRRTRATPESSARPWYRSQSIVTVEIVFWAVFALFLAYRLINPDSYHPVWGGEKPMEFAHINAILRSAHFPPHDPWYADGLLNYYYYGMYLVAFMMKLTGIPSEIAFNLAQPTMMAMLAAGAFSVASAISFSLTRSRAIARIGGLAGVVLVSFSGNLIAAARVLETLTEGGPSLADFLHWFWYPTRWIPFTIHEFPYFTGTYADLHAHVVALPITVLIIGLCFALAQDTRRFAIATRRPHAFPSETNSLLLTLGLLALAIGTLFVTNAWDVPTYAALTGVTMMLATRALSPLWARLAIAGGVTIAVGLLTYALVLPFSLHYVALYGEVAETRIVSPLVLIEGHFGVFFLIVTFGLSYLLSRLWTNPPLICRPWFFSSALGVVLLVRWYAAGQSARWVEIADNTTVLLVVGWLMLSVLWAAHRRLDFGLPSWLLPIAVLGTWAGVVWALAVDKTACALFLGLGFVAAMIWLMMRPVAERFIAALIAAGMFVGAGVELIYLVDSLSGTDFYRMNTLFKFYNGIWILLALASAALVTWMLQGATDQVPRRRWTISRTGAGLNQIAAVGREPAVALGSTSEPPFEEVGAQGSPVNPPQDWRTGRFRRAPFHPYPIAGQWAQVGLVVSIVAIVASLAYPVLATGVRLNQHFPQSGSSWTLNALDWMDYGEIPEMGGLGVVYAYDEDRKIIEWFNSDVGGSPVIAEVSIDQYRCGGTRISVHTGLLVVVGWVWHESQQRDWVDLQERQNDLRTLYTTTDPQEKLDLLETYRIEYVVVGELEQSYPSNGCESTDNVAGIAAFEPLVGSALEVAFTAGDSLVYRVIAP
ncbi:MAG: hypothetical protein H0T93_01265 [Chloroflexia bacterium]|nr:hypothetical protein [Chloroflexia bacterium]